MLSDAPAENFCRPSVDPMLRSEAASCEGRMLVVMLTALYTTKLPILLGHSVGRYRLMPLQHYGVLSFLHEARLDLAMILALVAVAIDRGVRLVPVTPWYQARGR